MIGLSIHQIASVSAYRHDYADAPLKLIIQKSDTVFPTEIILFLDDDPLTTALARAINETIAAHQKPAPENDLEAAE